MAKHRVEKWARGAIRITSEVITTREVTQKLRLKPTRTYEKGEHARTKSSHPATWSASVWVLDSGLPSTAPLEAHIETLLDKLEDHTEVLQELAIENEVEFFLGFSSATGQGGFTLEHDILGRLAALPVAVTLDLYPPEGSSDPAT